MMEVKGFWSISLSIGARPVEALRPIVTTEPGVKM